VQVQQESVHPLVRKLATATCLVALLPISMGALVTTLKAGMAFADWPSSDGHNMLLYPWFQDFATNPQKFTEHGHRLAGMLIGFVSVVLAVAGWRLGDLRVRVVVTSILVAVILQGLLGGARVLLDQQVLAMTHSITGAAFFSLCIVFRLYCSTGWTNWLTARDSRLSPASMAVILISPIAVMGQYILGGMLRHLHIMLNEHLVGAAVAGTLLMISAVCLLRAEHVLLKRCGLAIVFALCLQLLLGAGSYLTRFGLPMIGYVATSGSLPQAIVCSLHTVFGMVLLSSAVAGAVAVLRLSQAGCLLGLKFVLPVVPDRGATT
jgi:cytochrome c oxidase assembly protein subunit 15